MTKLKSFRTMTTISAKTNRLLSLFAGLEASGKRQQGRGEGIKAVRKTVTTVGQGAHGPKEVPGARNLIFYLLASMMRACVFMNSNEKLCTCAILCIVSAIETGAWLRSKSSGAPALFHVVYEAIGGAVV
mmetsp:Transcript_32859/g.51239  ORF Transcript_32859/g.51239 Transcript_32859/m.51239 type:complete len:130 (+) Transcript_32859:1189-1578(+)